MALKEVPDYVKDKPKLTLYERREIAEQIWRLFLMTAPRAVLSFDGHGVTIRVPFNEEMDLDGPAFILGVVDGHRNYKETAVTEKRR